MRKQKKNSRKKTDTLQVILLTTAIIQLISTIVDLINKLLTG